MRKAMVSLILVMGTVALMAPPVSAAEVVKLMVYTETAGFRHASITAGIAALNKLVVDEQFEDVDFTVEQVPTSTGAFTDANLARFDVAVFVSTTGNVLDATEQAAFERWVRAGGGYVGIHAAADAEYTWPWYGDLVGGWFKSHPNGTPQATVIVEDAVHASTAHLPARWTRVDEWYNYRQNPRSYVCQTEPEVAGVELQTTADVTIPTAVDQRPKNCGVHVLLKMDETTYSNNGDAMGADHPISWCDTWDGGRTFYTGLGHTDASFTEPNFLTHVSAGILTAAGIAGYECVPAEQASS